MRPARVLILRLSLSLSLLTPLADRPANAETFAVVFKSYPEGGWLAELEGMGLVPLEPVPSMGYLVWGSRPAISSLPGSRPWVQGVFEVPAGLKRFRVDTVPAGDPGGPSSTVVTVVDEAGNAALEELKRLSTRPVNKVFTTGRLTDYGAYLTPQQGIEVSRRPDVLAVSRQPLGAVPADERSNRIIGGTFGTPGTSWPTQIGTNPSTPQFYWDAYMTQLANAGIDPQRQTIGFLDTGVDEGFRRENPPTDDCPPSLGTAGPDCRLVFTTDASLDFGLPERKADDWRDHGSAVVAIAGGRTSSARDTRGYAFAQGVAPGVNVAMSKILFLCNGTGNDPTAPRPQAQPGTDGIYEVIDFMDMQQLLRYSLVEMTCPGQLPERPAPPEPPVRILNHSWRVPPGGGADGREYDTVSKLIDVSARDLGCVSFAYQVGGTAVPRFGADGAGALHVIAAGNRTAPAGDVPLAVAGSDQEVVSPANAKNGLTVGATRTDDPRTCDPDPGTTTCWGAENLLGSNPRVVAGFSRIGYPNLRLKPDLVAPGSRVYGPFTQRNFWCQDICLIRAAPGSACVPPGPPDIWSYFWMRGTSFAAPAVSGAAALVRDWLGSSFGRSNPSSALLRALMIATAKNLVPARSAWGSCCDDPGNPATCWDCWDMRPAPDQYQGWGGASLDRLFGATSRYYLYDQGTTFTSNGQVWSKVLTITDPTKPISLALTWTDRATATTNWNLVNLVNDLDLEVTIWDGQGYRVWAGNVYYCDRDAVGSGRTGYSLDSGTTTCGLSADRKNNVEKIDISPARIPAGATQMTVTVRAFALTGDGVEPCTRPGTSRQDFALAVENGHE
ncbi:hypothetical protein FBQ97_02715 [Acidobacteria bacterium ACD]|nr:hypothetical protein [Acidobacteria bacterium ACD]